MHDEKVLTVSVAAYNVEEYLDKAVRSCASCNDDRIEVIIVNDGSTDETLGLARSLEEDLPWLVRVIDKENGGYGSTVNASLDVARGRYFRYLDGDDWFMENALVEYLDVLEAASADAVYAPYTRCFEGDGREELIDPIRGLVGEIVPDDVPEGVALAGCVLAYRTELLREINFRMSEHRFYADIEFAYIPIAHASRVLITHIPIYAYRIGREGQSVSISGIANHYDDIIFECSVLLDRLASGGQVTAASGARSYIGRILAKEVIGAVRFTCLATPTAEVRKKLLAFDAEVRRRPTVYRCSSVKSKLLRALRATKFWILPIAHKVVLKRKTSGE